LSRRKGGKKKKKKSRPVASGFVKERVECRTDFSGKRKRKGEVAHFYFSRGEEGRKGGGSARLVGKKESSQQEGEKSLFNLRRKKGGKGRG